jgi:hypothetical protein
MLVDKFYKIELSVAESIVSQEENPKATMKVVSYNFTQLYSGFV